MLPATLHLPQVLERYPDVLRDMGESRVELTAEYGEMTTRD